MNYVEEVKNLRAEGMGMFDIASKIYDISYPGDDVRPKITREEAMRVLIDRNATKEQKEEARKVQAFYMRRNKEIDRILCSDGGVYDIIMDDVPKDPSLENYAMLAAAVIESAIEDYGVCKTDHAEYAEDFITAKHFFESDMYHYYTGIINSGYEYPDGKTLMKLLDRQAEEGRWLEYTKMIFKTKRDAQKMIDDHPVYTLGKYEVCKKKGKKWGLRLIYIPAQKEEEE